jgi:adenylate cyclase
MSTHTANLAILFADICGSTALYDNLGDQTAQRLMAACVKVMRDTTCAHQGTVVKTIGDEVMCTFPNATVGLEAARAMQSAMQNARFDGGVGMHISIGLHYGSVICEGGDVFGDTVNVAARIASQARAHQIMTSQAVVDALPEASRRSAHRIMAAEFKGKQVEFDIFIVTWNEEDEGGTQIRVAAPPLVRTPATVGQLSLSYGSKTFTLNQDLKKIVLGRGENCDLVIASTLTSRLHASIEFRFGKFYIVDHSSNGTYIRAANGDIMHITREERVLQGTGVISPGQSFAESPAQLISYSIF